MANLLHLLRAVFGNRVRMLEDLGSRIPRAGREQYGRLSVVLVNHPELVPEVLIDKADDFHKGPILRVIARPLLGDGLLSSEEPLHRERRKMVAPAFAHQRVSRYAGVMTELSERVQASWKQGQQIDVAEKMMRLTLDIVGRTLFDADLLGQADSLGRDITLAQQAAIMQTRLPFRLPFRSRPEAAVARMNQTMYALIAERRASGVDKGDLLSMLLLSKHEDTGAQLTDKDVRDEAITLFIAGHETTAQAMAWSWYLLACNPQYFARLRSEGTPFALQVMKESMRLCPPAFLLARTAIRDTSVGGVEVRAGELVLIAPWLLHRDSRFFEEPLRFDPDRFLPEREAAIPKFAYLPFGGGRRICIGNQFALMEGQIILATMGRHIETELVSHKPVGLEPLLTLRPKGGIRLRVRRV